MLQRHIKNHCQLVEGSSPSFIASNQYDFVKDKLLMENMLFEMELVKDYHKELSLHVVQRK